MFSAIRLSSNNCAITIEFCYGHNRNKWNLTCIYAPCTPDGKSLFLEWFKDMQIDNEDDHLILGDFNLIRKMEDRNKPGGNINNMFRFNAAINILGVNEINLQGRKYTWSNKQPSPLQEKLDWIFTSSSWAISYTSTTPHALDMIPSDHCPFVVNICTTIPKTSIFRLENFWLKHHDFQQVLLQSWSASSHTNDSAMLLTAKFKKLRRDIK